MKILEMIDKINAQVKKLSQKKRPKYIRESKWVRYYKDAFSRETWKRLNYSQRKAYEQDIRYAFKTMPEPEEIKREYNDFIKNFNTILEEKGVNFRVNYRNAQEFKDFIDYYDSIRTSTRYRSSEQILEDYEQYVKLKRKNDISIEDYFKEYTK